MKQTQIQGWSISPIGGFRGVEGEMTPSFKCVTYSTLSSLRLDQVQEPEYIKKIIQ